MPNGYDKVKTFSDRDIVRIFLRHLDAEEQQRVINYFKAYDSTQDELDLLCSRAYPTIVGVGSLFREMFGDAEVFNQVGDNLHEISDWVQWLEIQMDKIEVDYLWFVPPRSDSESAWWEFSTPVDDFWYWWDGLKYALSSFRATLGDLLAFFNVVGATLESLESTERAMRPMCNPDYPVELSAFSAPQAVAWFRATKQIGVNPHG